MYFFNLFFDIFVFSGMEDEVYRKLKKMEADHPEVKVYRRSDTFMIQLNYSSNDRISPLIITVDEGYYLVRAEYEIKDSTSEWI